MAQMDGRISLVTGASSGIGRATALLLSERGSKVALVALPGEDLQLATKLCRDAGAEAVSFAADVSDPDAVAAAFAYVESTLGGIDAVFNNAGVSVVKPVHETTDEDWQRVLGTNLSGSFYVSREAARVMIPRRRGAIVSTGSDLAILGQAGYAAYTATKGGVLAMNRALAADLGQYGIRVNVVIPGAVDTPLLRSEFDVAADPMAERTEMEGTILFGRFAEPEELARTVVFLLSDEASYVTGTQIAVDAGRTTCIPSGSLSRIVTA